MIILFPTIVGYAWLSPILLDIIGYCWLFLVGHSPLFSLLLIIPYHLPPARVQERSRPKEFHLLEAMDVAFALALPTAKRDLSTWQPFKSPEAMLKAMAKWQDLGDKNRFSALLDATLIPQLRKAWVDSSNPLISRMLSYMFQQLTGERI